MGDQGQGNWLVSGQNKGTRPYLKGEAGAELQKYIQTTGVDFRCPKLGFNIDERYGTMAHSEIILDVLQKHMSVAATGTMWMRSGQRNILSAGCEGRHQ